MSPSEYKPLQKGLWKNINPGAYFRNFTVLLLASFWKWEFSEHGNGLLVEQNILVFAW